jgi:endoglucanase
MLRRLPTRPLLMVLLIVMAGTLAVGRPNVANAVDLLAPPQVPGIAVYIPYDVGIKVDGKLDDWARVPVQSVDYGPKISGDYLEDGEFRFQVAADETNLYLAATANDKNIIAGKHAGNYWNEDSMEFYLNTSGDMNAHSYGDHIWQVNINAADIGKTNPDGLTLTGVNSNKIKVHGYVFKTTLPYPGYGFEISVPMSDLGIKPESGKEIGFSMQLNGASVLDRNVQLNWSTADTNNTSYQDPAKFGTAIFFKTGQTVVPTPARIAPTPTPTPPPAPPQVSVNQVGYYPGGPKIASFNSPSAKPLSWKLVDSAGNDVASGQTTIFGKDSSSGDNVHLIDFTSYTATGTGYKLYVGSVGSDTFKISSDLYSVLQKDALAYFYRDRSGIELTAQYAGAAWARPAGTTSDDHVTCYKGKDVSGKDWPGCDYYLDVSGGWYDAGDYGKYVVNGGIAVWTMLNQYELSPTSYKDGQLNIPENKNGVPDILDEARWELKFMLSMQVPAGQALAGMVHHKIHDDQWSAMPSLVPTTATNRYLFPPSTAATLNLAAVGAQCARIWKTIDPAFSAQCLTASETAWAAAQANPTMYAVSFAAGGGDYGDTNVTDEFYWAASELYIATGKDVYKDFALASPSWANADVPDWGHTAALGTISLALVSNNLPSDKVDACRKGIIYSADRSLGFMSRQGYQVPLANFQWGSNSEALNAAMLMGLSYGFTADQKYLDGATKTMDYILGRNPINQSYVTGYGTKPSEHPHQRFWGNQPSNGFPAPPPGVVVGGANDTPNDPAAQDAGLTGSPAERSYLDNIGSFTTNEVAINWNAPLAWVTAFVDRQQNLGPAVPATSAPKKDDGVPIPLLLFVPAAVIIAGGLVFFWVRRKGRRGGADA